MQREAITDAVKELLLEIFMSSVPVFVVGAAVVFAMNYYPIMVWLFGIENDPVNTGVLHTKLGKVVAIAASQISQLWACFEPARPFSPNT